jgi:hypothetical protein
MKMRKTYIIFGSRRLVTTRDRGAVIGEDRLETVKLMVRVCLTFV